MKQYSNIKKKKHTQGQLPPEYISCTVHHISDIFFSAVTQAEVLKTY